MSNSQLKSTKNASNVYLFKNGYGMIVKTFEFPSSENREQNSLELLDLPSHAVHGTFWIQPTSTQVTIKSMRTKKTKTFVEQNCLNVDDLVRANVGENVQLKIVDQINKTSDWVVGKIQSVQSSNCEPSDSDNDGDSNELSETSAANSVHIQTFSAPRQITDAVKQGNLILFDTNEDGILGLPLSNIHSIRSRNLKTKYQRKVFRNCLSINYQNNSDSAQGGLMKYLTYGITWVPSYDIVLLNTSSSSEKRLQLSSKAVILNDIENIHVKNLFCIVGFPNISKFASVVDPTINNSDVKEFLGQLQQSESGASHPVYHGRHSAMSNSVMMQQMVVAPSFAGNTAAELNPSTTDNDDLHLYDFHDVLLEKKKRLVLPIFNIDLPYKDVYSCDIDSMSHDSYYHQQNKQDFEEVWHSIEIKNESNFTWTTAPAVVTKGLEEQQFLGQDKITYTLKGSTALINLTKALDIRVQVEESVTNTNPNRIVFLRNNYQTDTITGKITITNHKSEDIRLVIKMKLTGKMVDFTTKPTRNIVKANSNAVNQTHDIRWELDIKAKQSLEIKHTRHFNKPI